MPVLTTIGNHFSHILHNLIFSFPSPNATSSDALLTPDHLNPIVDSVEAGMSGLDGMMSEPGEPRALAGGVGPLSFVGSGYGVMLILMGILLNRIHHIVRRARPPRPPLPHPPVNSLYARTRASLADILTSPSMPNYLRIPGIICLFRAWALFSILTLQVADLWPIDPPRLLNNPLGKIVRLFGEWAGDMAMDKVCWQVFLSVCAGLVCSGLANGLDRGRRRDVGAGFNLFGYSFLLHLYSSPLTHHHPPPAASHGRPDIHALFQLWLSLTELTWLQTIELSPPMRRNQLLPTAICGSLGVGHFVYALSTAPLKFPSFTFLTHLMALVLSVVIVFSIILKAFTHLFTIGYLPSPVLVNLLPHEGVIPSIEDDFGVALLKLGTACIEATQYSGLRNELMAIEEKKGPWVELSASGSDVFSGHTGGQGGFHTEITNIEVSELQEPHGESVYWKEMGAFWKACFASLASIGWSLLLATPGGLKGWELTKAGYRGRWWYGPRQWRFWRREVWAEPPRFQEQAAAMRRLEAVQRQHVLARRAADDSSATSTAVQLRLPSPDPLDYGKFLRGEIELEDDDEEWQDKEDNNSSSSTSGSDGEEEQNLYQDMLAPTDLNDGDDLQPVLLAHLTTHSVSPLTRRRYADIVHTPTNASSSEGLHDVVVDRRLAVQSSARDEWDDDRRRSCVVCTIEPRDTILWPCRCLALCNDCRESLASRLAASEHMCPCCRRKVEGFSRIYIP